MILKQVIGRGTRGLLNYISQPIKTDHNHTHPFFTNMAGQTPRELATEVASLRKLRPNLARAVGHLIISNDPRDRFLSDQEMQHVVSLALNQIGAGQAAFAAYRHADTEHQHTHIFSTRLALWASDQRRT